MLDLASKVQLHNGTAIPRLGLGVYQTPASKTVNAVLAALETGYRHIDTASVYGNEKQVASAVKQSGILRNEIFVTSKLWDSDQGTDRAERAIKKTMSEMKDIDYVDLYLVHSPYPGKRKRLETWKVLNEHIGKEFKAIGVSNYGGQHIREIVEAFPESKPVLNQLQLHPWCRQTKTVETCREYGIELEAWAPLAKGDFMMDKIVASVAKKHKKSPAQILIRWSLQHDFIALPKSENPGRMKENSEVYDFELDAEDMEKLDNLDQDHHTDWNPTTCP